ncbi:MAG: glycosyltransferase [Burkholderiales bacterium]
MASHRLKRAGLPYPDWVAGFDTLAESDIRRIRSRIASLAVGLRFHVVLEATGAGDLAAGATLASLQAQLYREFDCTVLDDMDPGCLVVFNAGLKVAVGSTWVMRLRAGDVLPPHALYWFAAVLTNQPEATVIYADDDMLDASDQRSAPRFKPDWSLTHFRACNYVGDAVAIRGDALAATGGLDVEACRHGFYEKLLQVIDFKEENVIHLPAVLLHRGLRSSADDNLPALAAWEMAALRRHLSRRNVAAEVLLGLAGCRRVLHQLPEPPPLVSIIVPTRDAADLLRRCVNSVLGKTTYPQFEILVVDNQSSEPQALTCLRELAAHPAVRVLRYDRPFNFSAINNFAAREARGGVLCLLNNDTEVISPDWLDEMVGHLLQPGVGVVGAKLYYPDGRVQHAGDTVGPGGCANHLHSGIAREDPGYCNRAVVAQELSAVTAACLVTRRDLFIGLGGLDARWLKVAFNDVDYCLRVRAAGHQVVWTPHAELYHHESVSRGRNDTWSKKLRSEFEVMVMRRRWGRVMRNDPFYNPNLNYRRPDFTPGRMLRVKKPWL